MATMMTQKNLAASQARHRTIDHGLDLDALRLPILPPGPYVSSDGMSDDVEILEEAPVNMRKKQVVINLVDSDTDENVASGSGVNGDSDEEEDSEDSSDEDEPQVVIPGPSRRLKRKASTPPSSPERPRAPVASGSRGRTYTLGSAAARPAAPKRARVSGEARREANGAPEREPAMMIAFGDEAAQEVPLGWGGLGIPERNPPAAAAGRNSSPSNPAAGSSSARKRKASSSSSEAPEERSASPRAAVAPNEPAPAALSKPKEAADYLPFVLEILPDICTAWVIERLQAEITLGQTDPVMRVVTAACDIEGGYPKAKDTASSSKAAQKAEEENYQSEEYKKAERCGPVYDDKSQSLLNELFPMIPVAHLRASFHTHTKQLVPTYFALLADSKADPCPYQALKVGRNAKGKSRPILYEAFVDIEDMADDNPFIAQRKIDGRAMYDTERKWLVDFIKQEVEENDAQKAREMAHAEALANGGGMECGCCFGEELMENMFQCNEGHLFCRECTTMHVETKLGDQQHIFSCMDTSSCPALFPESELIRLLPAKSLRLYNRLKQASELEAAGIDGLETCPNCPFSAIIDNPDEKLFRCMAPECGTVTCRKCKREEHLPKTCEEMEADRKLDKRHTVEDAMSEALIRKCPKCAKPFVKESGCNKITCHMCHTISCYICRKVVTDGYAHFDRNPADYSRPASQGKCNLWDSAGDQDARAIVAARDAAQVRAREAAAAEGVQLADADLNVEAPVAPARPAHAHAHLGAHAAFDIYGGLDRARIQRANDAMAALAAQQAAMQQAIAANPGAHQPLDVAQYNRDMAEQHRIIQGLHMARDQMLGMYQPLGLGAAQPLLFAPPAPVQDARVEAWIQANRPAAAAAAAGPARAFAAGAGPAAYAAEVERLRAVAAGGIAPVVAARAPPAPVVRPRPAVRRRHHPLL